MKSLGIDLETFSSVDLLKCGVYRYASSPDFEILLFGFSGDGGDVRVVDLACGEEIPADIVEALSDDSVIKWSYNNNFERVCLSNYFGTWFEPGSWRCTMVWAAYMGLGEPSPYESDNPLLETTPYFRKYVFAGMGNGQTVVTLGFYEGINELFLKVSR